MGVIEILEQVSLSQHWYDATAVLWQFQENIELPCERSYLFALLHDCLRLEPNLGLPASEDWTGGGLAENLVWSIVSELKGVGYLSDYDPLKDPEVTRHTIQRPR